MLISEVKGWHYFISWDNPKPPNSAKIKDALSALGKVTQLLTKTSVAFSPRRGTHWRDVRSAIRDNLDTKKGNAFYVSLRSGQAFQIGEKTNWRWKKTPKARSPSK